MGMMGNNNNSGFGRGFSSGTSIGPMHSVFAQYDTNMNSYVDFKKFADMVQGVCQAENRPLPNYSKIIEIMNRYKRQSNGQEMSFSTFQKMMTELSN